MKKIVLIGASTGGPGHLKKIIKSIPNTTKASFIVVQHMNVNIINSFVSELSRNTELSIDSIHTKETIKPASIYVCANTLELNIQNNQLYLDKSTNSDIYTPSINILFLSALKLIEQYKIIAILLTGIGDDGAQSLSNLYEKGVFCIAESQDSAIVYGMPKSAYELNNNVEVMDLNKIIEYIKDV